MCFSLSSTDNDIQTFRHQTFELMKLYCPKYKFGVIWIICVGPGHTYFLGESNLCMCMSVLLLLSKIQADCIDFILPIITVTTYQVFAICQFLCRKLFLHSLLLFHQKLEGMYNYYFHFSNEGTES